MYKFCTYVFKYVLYTGIYVSPLLLQLFYKYSDGSVKGELSHSPNQPYSRTKSGKKGKKKREKIVLYNKNNRSHIWELFTIAVDLGVLCLKIDTSGKWVNLWVKREIGKWGSKMTGVGEVISVIWKEINVWYGKNLKLCYVLCCSYTLSFRNI